MKKNLTSLKKRSLVCFVFWMLVFSTFIGLPSVLAEEGEEEGEGSPPLADAGGPYYADECETIYFDASSSYDPDGDELWYRWNFDGTWTTWTIDPTDAYTWNDDFSGNISLEVTDGNFFVSDNAEVTVYNVAPTTYVSFGDFVIGYSDVELEVTVEFYDPTSRAVSDDSHIAEFDWGDGTLESYEINSGGFFVNGYHTYSGIGEYVLTVTIYDDDGGSSTISIIILVQGMEIGEDVTIYEGETFSSTGTFFYEEVEIFSGIVNYGDGSADESLLLNFEDCVFDLNHVYDNVGDFFVSVELFDIENNLIDSDSLTVHVLEVDEPEEGCSHGFWKNHKQEWMKYHTDDLIGDVFTLPNELSKLSDDTLKDALRYKGGRGIIGGARILLRNSVGSILNAAHIDVHYPMTEQDVKHDVNNALASLNRGTMLDLEETLDIYNNLGSPLCCD